MSMISQPELSEIYEDIHSEIIREVYRGVTSKQYFYLEKINYPISEIKKMTKKEAWQIISDISKKENWKNRKDISIDDIDD